jgi:hypothetical protein
MRPFTGRALRAAIVGASATRRFHDHEQFGANSVKNWVLVHLVGRSHGQ